MCVAGRGEEKRNAGEKREAAGRRASGEELTGTVAGPGKKGQLWGRGEQRAVGGGKEQLWGKEESVVGGGEKGHLRSRLRSGDSCDCCVKKLLFGGNLPTGSQFDERAGPLRYLM